MTFHRAILVSIMFAGIWAGTAKAGDPPVSARQATLYAATCTHYRTRLQTSRGEEETLLLEQLAQSCDRALARLTRDDSPDPVRGRAAGYLDRLARFKATIVTMNMRRMLDGQRTSRRVSGAGQYLIARRMGVLDAMRPWSEPEVFPVAGSD